VCSSDLLLVGLAAALRPSAVSGLTLEHVTRHVGGIELLLSRRKYDQDARGTRLWLPRGAPTCVRARRSKL
jgi:hypothetical protein